MRTFPRPASISTVTVGATAIQVLSPSPSRTSLLLSARGGTIWVSSSPTLAVGEGIAITAGVQPLQICTCHFGTFLMDRLFAIADGASRQLFILEGFEEQWLQNIRQVS